jgi:anti-sigma factor RsiW
MDEMNTLNCETIRDLLPELLSDRVSASMTTAVRAHLASCEECRAELALARAISEAVPAMPAGLDRRVLAAATRPRATMWTRGRLAAAASVAIAIVGASMWWSELGPRNEERLGTHPVVNVQRETAGAGFIGVDDAFATGASSLGDLTVEELEKLLLELDS